VAQRRHAIQPHVDWHRWKEKFGKEMAALPMRRRSAAPFTAWYWRRAAAYLGDLRSALGSKARAHPCRLDKDAASSGTARPSDEGRGAVGSARAEALRYQIDFRQWRGWPAAMWRTVAKSRFSRPTDRLRAALQDLADEAARRSSSALMGDLRQCDDAQMIGLRMARVAP
jgi:hypothetical protein